MNLSVSLSNTKQKKRVIASAIACSFLLVLPSCGIPTVSVDLPEYQADRADLPEVFNGAASPENSAQLGIEEFFNDPMLTSLIDQALAGNQELKILNEDVQIASNEILARQGRTFPSSLSGPARGWTNTAASRFREPAYATTRIRPGQVLSQSAAEFPVRRSTSPGSWTSGGSCGMPGTRQGSATSPPARGGTTS